ncbi:dihydroorotase [Spiroplasma corruscae]|uniref:Dihydroorotase n=1 Tax=Spiroplasma corruscae TaxID=216934 RepID=A0A222EPK5_9MOLU|nr:dihydroorotase [Spiroplasma corruscae]ASP28485.1 dihydroorotase [Spiroplasma corruscae]
MLLIKNAQFYKNDKLVTNDILIVDKYIKKISKFIKEDENYEVIDASNYFITPGLIDVHVHTREPGYEYKEDLTTVSKAALKGGVTTICSMANLSPVPDSVESYESIVKLVKEKSEINVLQMCAATKNLNTNELVDFEMLKKSGAKYFSNDGHGIQNTETMRSILREIKKHDLLISVHLETEKIKLDGMIHKSKFSKKYLIKDFSYKSEYLQLKRDIKLLKNNNCRYHVGHLTTGKSLKLIKKYKKKLNITCEVTPNHLLMSINDFKENSGLYKINPPIRTKKDQSILVKGLQDGTIDCIATDHAPHKKSEKFIDFKESSFGMIGIEFSFSILYTKLVMNNIISLNRLVELMYTNPNEIFRMKAPNLKEKHKANIVIWDLNNSYVIKEKTIESKSKNTPFLGEEVYGKNIYTIVEGKIKWRDD